MLVLEKCGTEVDDDEVLEEIADEVSLLLADGETYTPSVAQQIPDSTRSLVACTTGDVLQPSRSASFVTTKWQAQVQVGQRHMPVTNHVIHYVSTS